MKLVAIWIENHFNILKQGFDFGSRLKYSFTFDYKLKELTVVLNNNQDYFDLYEGSSIVNISGVLGENGSGKTSLLKLFNVMASNSAIPDNAVLVFEDQLTGGVEICKYKADFVFGDQNPISLKYIYCEPDLKHIDVEIKKTIDNPLREIEIIHYSNMISGQGGNYLKGPNFSNHSVSNQIRESMNPTALKRILLELEDNKENKMLFAEEHFNPLRLYYNQRQERIIKFLAEMKEENYSYATQIKFSRSVSMWFNENILKEYEIINGESDKFQRVIEIYHYALKQLDIQSDKKTKFKNALILHYFLFIFYFELPKFDRQAEVLNNIYFLKKDSVFQVLKKSLENYSSRYNSEEVTRIVVLLDKLDLLLETIEIQESIGFFSRGIYELSIDNTLWNFLEEINSISQYKGEPVLITSINPFSAGQDAIINQFSEFYEALKKSKKDNILITIDEGELYLHPEWQRQYINGLYTFFNYFGKKLNKNIQLLLTSHSPFIASDIPKFNLVFLKNEESYCKVFPSEMQSQTLGGNIFTLFKESFYLKEFIGEFAYENINEAILFINGKTTGSKFKNMEHLEKFVNLIGEPLIREQLQKMIKFKKLNDSNSFFELDEI